jgi:hypothetical protein
MTTFYTAEWCRPGYDEAEIRRVAEIAFRRREEIDGIKLGPMRRDADAEREMLDYDDRPKGMIPFCYAADQI